MKKESTILIGIFLFLAIGMHFSEWTTHPIEHIQALPSAGAYGLGWSHPILFTIAGYLLIGSVRLMLDAVGNIFKRSES